MALEQCELPLNCPKSAKNEMRKVCIVITYKVCKDFPRKSANNVAPKVWKDFQKETQQSLNDLPTYYPGIKPNRWKRTENLPT